jgi:thiol:disulfide interchange protein DsbA
MKKTLIALVLATATLPAAAAVDQAAALESQHFCDTCNRVRITADGQLHLCLGDDQRVDLLQMMRQGSFHYGCPHCRAFDPLVRQWLARQPDDVVFRHMPAIWGCPHLQGLARLFYALEATGELARFNGLVFDAVQTQKLPLHTETGVAEWVAKQGGDAGRFAQAWKSFGVQAKLQQADQLGRTLRIQAVPSVVVDGRYLTSASLAGSYENTLQVIDTLIVRARKEHGRG